VESNQERLFVVSQIVGGVADRLAFYLSYGQTIDSTVLSGIEGQLDFAVESIRSANGAAD
jgi:hypothetical protein